MRRAPRKRGLPGPRCARLLPLLCALAAWGCERPTVPPLAAIHSVEPDVIEPGDVLVIEGEGFVEGPATLVLDGELTPSGVGAPLRKRAAFDALAVSSARIELPVTSAVLSRLAPEPAMFRGSAEVEFPTALAIGSVRVAAALDGIALDLRPTAGAVEALARRTRDAEAVLHSLGIVPAEGGAGDDLVVGRVLAGSPADRAGLDPRDRLLALNGEALARLADLSGLDLRTTHSLSVMSPAGLPRELRLIPDPVQAWPADEFAALMLAAAALGLFLAFAAPARGRGWIPGAPRDADPLLGALGIAALTVPMLLLPAALLGGLPGLPATLGVTGLTVAAAVGAALYGGGGPLAGIGTAARGVLPAAAALLLAGAFGAAVDLTEVVAGQGSSPWGWHGWANPFAMAAVVAAAALLWPRESAGTMPAAARALTWVAACGGAMMLAACALGGWMSPGIAPDPSPGPLPLVARVAVFAIKCWLLLIAARWLTGAERRERRGAPGRRPPARLLATLGLPAALGLALAWEHAGLPGEIETAGRVLACGVLTTLAAALAGRRVAALLTRPAAPPAAPAAVSDPAIPSSAPPAPRR